MPQPITLLLPLLTQGPGQTSTVSRGSLLDIFAATGFIGPLMLIAGLLASYLAVRCWLELRPDRVAPAALRSSLEKAVQKYELEIALQQAEGSSTLLGAVVAAGLHLRRAGLDEMLANVERATASGALRIGNRIANLARLGGVVFLVSLFGTTLGSMSMLSRLASMHAPGLRDVASGVGDASASLALGLFVSLGCFLAYFWLDSRLAPRTLLVREIAEELMRTADEHAPAGKPTARN